MQNQQHVERVVEDRRDGVLLDRQREHHVQQVLRVIEVVARVTERLADIQFVSGRRDGRQLCEDSVRENITMLGVRSVHFIVVIRRHRADDGRQHGHRMGVVTEALEEIEHAFVEHRMRAYRVVELIELGWSRQVTVQEQVGDLQEIRMLRELLHRVAPVHEDALFAVDEGYVRFAATCRNEARVIREHPLGLIEFRDVDDVRSDGTFTNGQFHFVTGRINQTISILTHIASLFFPVCEPYEHSRDPGWRESWKNAV